MLTKTKRNLWPINSLLDIRLFLNDPEKRDRKIDMVFEGRHKFVVSRLIVIFPF